MEVKIFNIDGIDYNFKFFIERRNSTRASVTKNGVNIRIPKHLSLEKKQTEINSLVNWAIKKIESNPPEKKREYRHNDEINVFNKIYFLHIEIRDSEKN